ncbi:hypothetical protein CWC22_000365 [Pseudoalteromonas rubra]|uniref:Uncharacterized protein n=1 Tax=Pseudoalteromonas rubra TaxID=43658 RepID=A0A5S3UUI1_9GAMM|nr:MULTISPECIES: hypothetical protein [Pseudoalteromonas]QPB81554.1 hypothetical protein CWC22_000365 [Pseudoalteromonas rubra]
MTSQKGNLRSFDNTVKPHVQENASQAGTPEDLSRVLDIIQESVAPITQKRGNPDVSKHSDVQKATDAIVKARNALESANSDLKLAELELSLAKYNLESGEDIPSASLVKAVKDAEEKVAKRKDAKSKAEIELQTKLNNLHDIINS